MISSRNALYKTHFDIFIVSGGGGSGCISEFYDIPLKISEYKIEVFLGYDVLSMKTRNGE
jgi:hypothetical protein